MKRRFRLDDLDKITIGILGLSGGALFLLTVDHNLRSNLQQFSGAYSLVIDATVTFCTIMLLLTTLIQSRIARESLDEARHQRVDGSNPLLLPHGYGPIGHVINSTLFPGFAIENHGMGPALEVAAFVCQSNPDQGFVWHGGVVAAGGKVSVDQVASALLAGSAEYLLMEQVRKHFFDQGVQVGDEDAVAQLRCRDIHGREHVTYALYRGGSWVNVEVILPGRQK